MSDFKPIDTPCPACHQQALESAWQGTEYKGRIFNDFYMTHCSNPDCAGHNITREHDEYMSLVWVDDFKAGVA